MSLDFKLSDIADYETVCWIEDDQEGKRMNPVTEGLIFATMAIGIGEITKTNVEEFYGRLMVYERLRGAMLRVPNPVEDAEPAFIDRPFTFDEVVAHIGLRTNVFPKEPMGRWTKRVMEDAIADEKRAREYRARQAALVTAQ